MSSTSHSSRNPNRKISGVPSIRSVQGSPRRKCVASRAHKVDVNFDDAYSFALRTAFLHYILQPRKKKKQYVAAPQRASGRSQGVQASIMDMIPTGMASGNTLKLPPGFRQSLERRMNGVVGGAEKLGGFNDPKLKLSFGEAYTAFTESSFQRVIDRERKIEPLLMIFLTSATKAQRKQLAPDDESYKQLADRHLTMFVRLLVATLRENAGIDSQRPQLMKTLAKIEEKMMRNEDLTTEQYVEVEVPLTYEVKDMPMVQTVASIFGCAISKVQADIDANLTSWSEEAALKDYKTYQFRLSSDVAGSLGLDDFDVDQAFEEWRKRETPHLVQIIGEILSIRPELRGLMNGGGKPHPIRPQSYYFGDDAYAELSKMLTSDSGNDQGTLAADDASSTRSVEEPNYTFIPPDPRAFYKTILQYASMYDHFNADPNADFEPLSHQSIELMNELAVRWRIPQFTRHVCFVEVVAHKFLDRNIDALQLSICLDYVKEQQPEPKKVPFIQLYGHPLPDIDPSRWTVHDYACYKQAIKDLYDALLRDLFDIATQCYDTKPPSVRIIMHVLSNHIYNDNAFSERPHDAEEFSQKLEVALGQKAAAVYRGFLDECLPPSQSDWNFLHVVELGRRVAGLCERIKKRYTKDPEILGVSPFKVLVETMFPSFERDAHAFIERVLQVAKERDEELAIEDGFALYKELVDIRKIHIESLPDEPFAFHVESLLVDFVWRLLKNTEQRMEEVVERAIKMDSFQVRTNDADRVPPDDDRHSVSIIDMFSFFNQTADEIFKLEWDDDVHHARFMTALAKAFTSGIGRYCEIVEQRFAQEMDRPSTTDNAGSRTTQERLLQYAKEAWTIKENVEPFQFYPESFVKLNNIEWAMQQLDKLEKLMNVDGCAAVLSKVDSPKQTTRKSNKYAFTVKIVEAEDLKACDPNGTSDPYVVLGDERQKRLAKTRVIPRNLNPRWDESVEFTVSGAVNIIATIWDHDTFGSHDYVGRASLKLDPVHFSDYLPREFWLDLDTQGRLLLRVSMEGERDDVQFYFGKAFRHLKRTERDMVRKVTDKLTAHINASLSYETLRGLLSRNLSASVANLWKKRQPGPVGPTQADVENVLQPLFDYFNENFVIMVETLTKATMRAVMTRLWKEVLMAIESLLVPPLSEKPSTQKSLTQAEVDVVYKWLQMLFDFFNVKEDGEVHGVPAEVLKSPKWHELASLNFFYFDSTENLIRTSERMATASSQHTQLQLQAAGSRLSAPPTFGATFAGSGAFGSLGTVRRGKSIMMSRNLGTMRKAKEEKRKEAQADPSDDMILRILRMRPDAVGYLKERHRQKERLAATAAAAMIVRQSAVQGWSGGPAFGGAHYGRNNLPRR